MPTREAFAMISASADSAWRVLSDVVAWPQWLPTVAAVEALDTGTLSPGARFLVRQPKLRPAIWVVTELEPAHRFVWVARSAGLVMTAEHAIERQGPTACKVVLRFSFGGPLGGIVGRVFRSITESYLAQEAASLKRTVEAGGDGAARGEARNHTDRMQSFRS